MRLERRVVLFLHDVRQSVTVEIDECAPHVRVVVAGHDRGDSLRSRIEVDVAATPVDRKPRPASIEQNLAAAEDWRLVTDTLGMISDQIGEPVSIDILKCIAVIEVKGDLSSFGRRELDEQSVNIRIDVLIESKTISRSVTQSGRGEYEWGARPGSIVDEIVKAVTIEVGEARRLLSDVDRSPAADVSPRLKRETNSSPICIRPGIHKYGFCRACDSIDRGVVHVDEIRKSVAIYVLDLVRRLRRKRWQRSELLRQPDGPALAVSVQADGSGIDEWVDKDQIGEAVAIEVAYHGLPYQDRSVSRELDEDPGIR